MLWLLLRMLSLLIFFTSSLHAMDPDLPCPVAKRACTPPPHVLSKRMTQELKELMSLREKIRAESPISADSIKKTERSFFSSTEDTSSPLLHWYHASDIGERPIQQDKALFFNPSVDCPFFSACVADGHGDAGAFIAHKITTLLPKLACETLAHSTLDDTKALQTSICQAFKSTNGKLLKRDSRDELLYPDSAHITCRSGAPAVVTLIEMARRKLIIAHVGDCRALLINCATETAHWLTTDHRPGDKEERERIESCGGTITQEPGDWPRINGTTNMSRAFGDDILKPYGMICEPTVRIYDLPPERHALLLCSDGLTEGTECSPEVSADVLGVLTIQALYEPNPAQALVTRNPFGNDDNTTALIAVINP